MELQSSIYRISDIFRALLTQGKKEVDVSICDENAIIEPDDQIPDYFYIGQDSFEGKNPVIVSENSNQSVIEALPKGAHVERYDENYRKDSVSPILSYLDLRKIFYHDKIKLKSKTGGDEKQMTIASAVTLLLESQGLKTDRIVTNLKSFVEILGEVQKINGGILKVQNTAFTHSGIENILRTTPGAMGGISSENRRNIERKLVWPITNI
jgi:hypothetical protein